MTIGVIDTGYWKHPDLDWMANGQFRLLAQYNAMTNSMDAYFQYGPYSATTDQNGHGTHVTSLSMSAKPDANGRYGGVAPNARLVSIRAFNANGAGSYLDVIRGIDWAVTNKNLYNIRVLNMSFSAPPQSYYWEDPLNQAVMRAWQAGIVVVAAAGNTGPDPMTIGVPGNVPYVITVGAMSDNYTADIGSDDFLASFSSTGPTVEGFVKPDLVAPGGHILGLMASNMQIAMAHPNYQIDADEFTMSGTSQATAVVSGVVALMLQQNPSLTPDEVKCRLMSSARPAQNPDGSLAYSIFQQGAGVVNAYDAVYSTASGCANGD